MKEMPKTFDFQEAESRLYTWWEASGYFKPEIAGPDAKPFVISIPPPNVTGALHQGHALFVTLEDLMVRYERMRGRAALWVPGTDHASIATELQVENLLRREGTSREAVGRDEFLRRAWLWKEEKHGIITQQLRRLGACCDWDRERFTLDEGLSRAVREAFVRLWDEGLIYRGARLINWSPGLQTAVSDLEVERVEQADTLYYFRYPIEGEPVENGIPVATTRPETILGDTAVAVHPDDERYQHHIGKTCLVPMLNRRIPVIADEYVDRAFGAGALKITPGHDPNDYEIAGRHGLAIVNILNKDATLNENAGPYAGLDRLVAREKLWADMQAAGMVIKTEPYTHFVPVAQRGGELIEPMVSTQWFVKIEPLAAKALSAVQTGHIRIVPERFEKVYYNWLENIKDWCISRQLWWGHRIPAWHCPNGHITVTREDPTACAACGSTEIEQDPDVLDTWFSSGLWPFSTLGWPDDTPDLRRYYPTDIMETAYDILFFWVARMIMMGLWFTGREPFHTVYLHGLVRDEIGRKMSKTYGNVVDPIEVMDQYGADPLRFTLVTGSTPGNDMNLDLKRIEAMRNFGNKIWQMARFVTSNLAGEEPIGPLPARARHAVPLPELWILSRLNRLIETVQRLFDAYLYGEAGRQVYDFLWGEFADWYIEISKTTLYADDADPAARSASRAVLVHVLETCLRLLHPFMPFITEETWQYLPHEGDTLMLAQWPQANLDLIDEAAETEMTLLIDLIRGIRNARSAFGVEPGRGVAALFKADERAGLIDSHRNLFARLANVTDLRFWEGDGEGPAQAAAVVAGEVTCFLPLAGLIDIDAERARLGKALEDLTAQIARTEAQLNNPGFTSKAKPEVVERTRARLADLTAERESLEGRLKALS